MNTTNLFLTRKQHDSILTDAPSLLHSLFDKAVSRSWSLAGVTFVELPDDLYIDAQRMIAV